MFKTHALSFAYNRQATFQFPDIALEAGENLLVLALVSISRNSRRLVGIVQ